MLDFLSYYDQAGNEYADVRKMQVYAFDTLFTWFVPGAHRQPRHQDRACSTSSASTCATTSAITNGSFVFPTDLDYNAADPRTYPERFTVRVPDRARVLTHTHSIGTYIHDKWQVNVEPHAEPRAALRPAHLAVRQPLQPVLPGSVDVSGGQEQLPAADRLRLQHGRQLGDARRLRAVLREAVDRPVRVLPAQPRVLPTRSSPTSRSTPPTRARATGSSRPTRSWSTGRSSTGRCSTSCSRRAPPRGTPATSSSTTPTASCRRSTR